MHIAAVVVAEVVSSSDFIDLKDFCLVLWSCNLYWIVLPGQKMEEL